MGGISGSGAIIEGFDYFVAGLLVLVLLFKIFTFIDAACRPARAYEAAGKLTKTGWLIMLGLASLVDLGLTVGAFGGFGFGIVLVAAGLVAAIVYTVDVRPAVRSLSGKKRQGGGQHNGPYGPW